MSADTNNIRMVNTGVGCRGTYREFKSRLFPAVTAEAALPTVPELTLLDDVNNVDLTRQTVLQEEGCGY